MNIFGRIFCTLMTLYIPLW